MKKIVVVGAGICGLTAAYKLTKAGYKVLVVEKEGNSGGLARSFRYNGYTFDIGPHRLYTKVPQVSNFINDILKEKIIIPRKSGIYLFSKYLDWPLSPSDIFRLPVNILIKTCVDLILQKKMEPNNFKEYVSNRYTKTLYKCFFENYTLKFLKADPKKVHKYWAKIALERAAIDEKLNTNSLSELIYTMFLRKNTIKFIYPINGIDTFPNKISAAIEEYGGKILTNKEIDKIICADQKIESISISGKEEKIDDIIWTGSIHAISKLLNLPKPRLDYLNTVLYNFEIDTEIENKYQWCYFSDKDIPFVRITNYSMFSKYNSPKGTTALCAEVTCPEKDSVWNNPEQLVEKIKTEMLKLGIINQIKHIKALHIEKINEAYPILYLNYETNLAEANSRLKTYRNLYMAGRTGLFWYNNMDHSIINGLNVAEKIIG
ncbi:MAG: FAD-dependent oxidoreductase [Candidatus Omnitrophica bacterium]|nr:FAD-dependent oxidoreductase [Candidatus Omnitrophota bacterium]